MTWPVAFALTLAFELPVVLWLTRDDGTTWGRRLLVGAGASALTHPALWFVLHPWLEPIVGYAAFFVLAESLVIGVEGLWYRLCGVDAPWRVSVVANAVSAGVGLVIGLLV